MIFNKIKKCFLDKKYLHIKNAINLEAFKLNFNFDSMFHMLSMNNYLKVQGKKSYHTYQGLSMIGQILEVNKINIFKDHLNYIDKNLGDVFKPGNLVKLQRRFKPVLHCSLIKPGPQLGAKIFIYL